MSTWCVDVIEVAIIDIRHLGLVTVPRHVVLDAILCKPFNSGIAHAKFTIVCKRAELLKLRLGSAAGHLVWVGGVVHVILLVSVSTACCTERYYTMYIGKVGSCQILYKLLWLSTILSCSATYRASGRCNLDVQPARE